MNNKTVSIVLCTYNGEKYLREQIDSIINQTYPIYELIIQDDCSTDQTAEIIHEYTKRYSFIHFYTNKSNKGVNPNFFSALSRATGDYIAIADQDDIWEKNKIQLQMEAIGSHWLCVGVSRPFSEDGCPVFVDSRIPNLHLLRMLYVGTIPGHTFLFTHDFLTRLPDLSDIISIRCYDVILSMVAAAYNEIVYVNQLLVNQRRHIHAATYTHPIDNSFNIRNIFYHIRFSLSLYKKTRPAVIHRFSHTLRFLQKIDSPSHELKEAIIMCKLQCSQSPLSIIRLSLCCFRNCDKLFHEAGKRNLITRLRALFFPFSSSEYFRHLTVNNK